MNLDLSPLGAAFDVATLKFKLIAGAIALVVLAAIVAAIWGWVEHGKSVAHAAGLAEGKQQVQKKWDDAVIAQQKVDLAASQENAVESKRRMAKQQENQDAQNAQLARERADADRNRRDAEQLRRDHETATEQWRRTLADSPSAADLAAAADAIGVCTDVLGRADKRASILAEIADARGAAGLKCQRDYDALEVKP
jgi:hypothetical protein